MCRHCDAVGALRDGFDGPGPLGHIAHERFDSLLAAAERIDAGEIERFFKRRRLGVGQFVHSDRDFASRLIDLDLRASAASLSFLLSERADDEARAFLPDGLAPALSGDFARLDHVGLEVFGQLEWYIDALTAWAESSGVRLAGYRVFPSVQVHKALAGDAGLSGVRIARVYFERDGRVLNLEMFEAMQHWLFTALRELTVDSAAKRALAAELMAELEQPVASRLLPIRHVALKVRRAETVAAVHAALTRNDGGAWVARPYDAQISYNPGDASLNTKLIPRDAAPRLAPVVEVISYGRPALA